MVGANASAFTANWAARRVDPFPSSGETDAFVAEYEVARGAAFMPEEVEMADAAYLYRLAYSARCEHSDATLGIFPDLPNRGWRSMLRARNHRGS